MYQKSILRSMVMDGGISLSNAPQLRSLLAEQAQKSANLSVVGLVGGGVSIVLGALMASLNPVALVAVVSGGYSLYLANGARATTHEEKEFRLLSRHGRVINLLGQYVSAGHATVDEVLSAYESLLGCYLMSQDAIAFNGQAIAASEVISNLPQLIQAQRAETANPAPALSNSLPPQRKSAFGPSRLHEYAKTPAPAPAPAQQTVAVDGSPIAVLERAAAQVETIGLPDALKAVTVDQPYSTFIIGMSGAGKDVTLYNLVAAEKAKYPTAFLVGVDGKNHQSEAALWAIYDRALRISMLDKPQSYHQKLLRLLKEACEFPGMVFFCFSELTAIAASYEANLLRAEWAEVSHYLRYLAIQGNGDRKYLLSTGHGVTLDDLGIPNSARSNIQFMMLANGSQFGFVNSITANTTVFNRGVISNQNAFTAACSRSPALAHLPVASSAKGVAYFHTALNRWEPMPRLDNPGDDRSVPMPSETPPVNQPIPSITQKPNTIAQTQNPIAVPLEETWESDPAFLAETEIDELIDAALETLRSNIGKAYSLTKLFPDKRARGRWHDVLIEALKTTEDVVYIPKHNGPVLTHSFKVVQK